MGIKISFPKPASKFATREAALEQINKLSDESLRIIAEISAKPGAEDKLKSNETLIKNFL